MGMGEPLITKQASDEIKKSGGSSGDPYLFNVRGSEKNPSKQYLEVVKGQVDLNNSVALTAEYDVYLFANPRSGGQKAKRFIRLDFDSC